MKSPLRSEDLAAGELERGGGAGGDALGGHLAQPLVHRAVKGNPQLHVEAASDKGQAERFARPGRNLDAQLALDTLARLEHNTALAANHLVRAADTRSTVSSRPDTGSSTVRVCSARARRSRR